MNCKPRHSILKLMRIGDALVFNCSQWQFNSAASQLRKKNINYKFTTKKYILLDPVACEASEVTIATRIS
jgi:hydroxyethylthiazole kinase-like sugar kinase family protein